MTDNRQIPMTGQYGRPVADPQVPRPDVRTSDTSQFRSFPDRPPPPSPYGPPQTWTGSFASGPNFPMPPPAGSLPPPPRRKRRRLLLSLLAVVVVGTFGYALTDGRDASAPNRAAGTEVAEPTALSPIDLQPGDCYNAEPLPADGSDAPINSVEAVPCTDPHTAQVITKLGYAGQDYTDVVETRAPVDCAAETQALLRPEVLADPAYAFGQIHPTSLSWPRTPTIACIVVTETPTTGSSLI
jgi:hypothetical protein